MTDIEQRMREILAAVLEEEGLHASAKIIVENPRVADRNAIGIPAVLAAMIRVRKETVREYAKALKRIASLDPMKDSENGWNEWGEADCFNQAQNIARSALSVVGPFQ